ncbi:MAG: site-specific tyrosine recombinase XerD [Bacteroidales bacterium]|nr:site-specific tyrosine recombinase XerD [Bacteroidales bacterium]MBQ4299856.1 site-specific tyrosine recombinase XerD [Bacteroidales bacterium]
MDIIRDFQNYLKIERGMSPNTVSSYSHDAEELLEFCKGLSVKEISTEKVVDFLGRMTDRGVSKRSQARVLSSLRSFFSWCIEEGEIESDPCARIDMPKLGKYIPSVLSVDEVTRIIESVAPEGEKGKRDRAILEVLYGCGLRVSEAASLKISGIWFKEGFVSIVGKGDKQRLVPLGETASDAIKAYLEERPAPADRSFSDVLFLNRNGRPLSRVSIFKLVKTQAMAAGIDKEISPHTFRHCFATHLIENGADLRLVQEMLGHASILTTEIYTHIDSSTWHKAILEHHPRR